MKKITLLTIFIAALSFSASSQTKTNDTIARQIKALRCEKSVELTYDRNSNVSKLMAVTENFPDHDAGKAGVQAMNFAVGFMYVGQEITKAPENILLTFWVLTRKPRFAQNHSFVVNDDLGNLDFGPARYVAKPRENMEYINFEISRVNLTRLINKPEAGFTLGENRLTFTKNQQKAISDLLTLSDPAQ